MLRRLQRRFTRTFAAIMACIAVLVYGSASLARHAPDLHVSASSVGSQAHGHDHGDHSHDDEDVADVEAIDSDHHHADHTHDTAGLLGMSDVTGWPERQLRHVVLSFALVGGPPFEIDRPPRSMT